MMGCGVRRVDEGVRGDSIDGERRIGGKERAGGKRMEERIRVMLLNGWMDDGLYLLPTLRK